jgi:hypothetical protein
LQSRPQKTPTTVGVFVFCAGGWVSEVPGLAQLGHQPSFRPGPNVSGGAAWVSGTLVPKLWCFSSGAFVGHVKLMFIRGTEIEAEPPVTPIGMGKSTRGVELASVKDLDEHLVASWMKQASAMPP